MNKNNSSKGLQTQLMDKILSQFVRKADVVEVLMRELNLGKNAVYRRLRGESLLSPDEIQLLARKFQISLDHLVYGQTDEFFCDFNALNRRLRNFEDFLGRIRQDLEVILQMPELHLYYATQEIPVFHYLFFPKLAGFKLYIWGQTTWSMPFLEGKKYSPDLLTVKDVQLMEELLKKYLQIPSTELWNRNIYDNTLNQIEYIAQTQQFADPNMPFELCENLRQLLHHQQQMAAKAAKFQLHHSATPHAVFQLYHNEIAHTNNTFQVVSALGKKMYSTFCNPNFTSSTDHRLNGFLADWFSNIIAKSVAISGHNSKGRLQFFQRLEQKIDYSQRRMEVLDNH